MGGMAVRKWLLAVCLMTALCVRPVSAESMISASVQVRASRNVYDSVIRAGEDVDMTVDVAGFVPAVCQWYFADMPIDGENAAALHIDSAEVMDTGVYRMDALDEEGRVRLSVDVALRVVDQSIPRTGDSRIPQNALRVAVASAASVLLGSSASKRQKNVPHKREFNRNILDSPHRVDVL